MPDTIVDPGTISVPLSTILDALEEVLTDEERDALSQQLTALRPAGVAPGDLITADLFNRMRYDIDDLLARVAVLEGAAGGPVIERIDPQTLEKQVGSLVTIIGANFRPDEADTRVLFGDIEIADFFPASDERTILVPVPVSFPQLPVSNVPVRVRCRGKLSNAVGINVVAAVVAPDGFVSVTYRGEPLGEIEDDTDYDLVWRVQSQINVSRTFTLEPVVTAVVGSTQAAWLAGITLPPGEITLQPGEFEDVTMTVHVPNGAASADINLRAESTVGTFIGLAQSPFQLVVGEETAVSDPRASIDPAEISTDDLRRGNIIVEGQTLTGFKMRPSKTLNLPFQLSSATPASPAGSGAGFYVFEAVVEPGPQNGRWTPGAMSSAKIQIAAGATHSFFVPMTSSSTVDTTTVSWLRVTAKCFETNASPQPKFTSFERVPIVGKS